MREEVVEGDRHLERMGLSIRLRIAIFLDITRFLSRAYWGRFLVALRDLASSATQFGRSSYWVIASSSSRCLSEGPTPWGNNPT